MNLVDAFTPALAQKNQSQPTPTSDSSDPKSLTSQVRSSTNPENRADASKIQKAIDEMNRKLQHEDREVVFDYDAKAHRVWLNLIDKKTGVVLEEMPPKIIRQLVDNLGDIKGLIIDKRS